MSGPVSTVDAPPEAAEGSHVASPGIEIRTARDAMVGAIRVRRSLPRRERRTVGAWCFVDHMGPASVTETASIDVGPHPHTGLHTVTWLLEGDILHRDSLGSEQVIRPGQLNLMTAGHGVVHSEEATGTYRGQLHGVQLWLAQPESTRHGPAAFEHHPELPRIALGHSELTLLVGAFDGQISPARTDTPLIGCDVVLHAGRTEWPLEPAFEHALVLLDGSVDVDGQTVEAGELAYLGLGRAALELRATANARLLLLGGAPLNESIVMWWNFVARTRAEVETATRDWNTRAPRFGSVASPLAAIPAPPVPDGLRP